MAGKQEHEKWWNGLSAQQRAEAVRCRDTGQLSDDLEQSLRQAGVIGRGKRKDRSVPGEVTEYLKMRH